METNIFFVFFKAISNELALDKHHLNYVIKDKNMGYTPLRVIKTYKIIKKYKITQSVYFTLCIIYILFSPFYLLIILLKNIYKKIKNNNFNKNKKNSLFVKNMLHNNSVKDTYTVILLANRRTNYLYKTIFLDKNTNNNFSNFRIENDNSLFININQNITSDDEENTNYYDCTNHYTILDLIKSYYYSMALVYYYLFKSIRLHPLNINNILQTYMVFNWTLTYIQLKKFSKSKIIKTVIFSNHFDRWATMFDLLFHDKQIILIQHGLIDTSLHLEYKLRNINFLLHYNDNSKQHFAKIFQLHNNVTFVKFNISLNLIHLNNSIKSLLIIGQPISINTELEIINYFKGNKDIFLYVKPHPLFSSLEYYHFSKFENIIIIKDNEFYPYVKLALTYQSTLGLEYQTAGVDVLWWKGLHFDEIIDIIKLKFNLT